MNEERKTTQKWRRDWKWVRLTAKMSLNTFNTIERFFYNKCDMQTNNMFNIRKAMTCVKMWICTLHVTFVCEIFAVVGTATALSPCQLNFNTFYEAHWMCCHCAPTFRMQYHLTSFDSFSFLIPHTLLSASVRRALYISLVHINKERWNEWKKASFYNSFIVFIPQKSFPSWSHIFL